MSNLDHRLATPSGRSRMLRPHKQHRPAAGLDYLNSQPFRTRLRRVLGCDRALFDPECGDLHSIVETEEQQYIPENMSKSRRRSRRNTHTGLVNGEILRKSATSTNRCLHAGGSDGVSSSNGYHDNLNWHSVSSYEYLWDASSPPPKPKHHSSVDLCRSHQLQKSSRPVNKRGRTQSVIVLSNNMYGRGCDFVEGGSGNLLTTVANRERGKSLSEWDLRNSNSVCIENGLQRLALAASVDQEFVNCSKSVPDLRKSRTGVSFSGDEVFNDLESRKNLPTSARIRRVLNQSESTLSLVTDCGNNSRLLTNSMKSGSLPSPGCRTDSSQHSLQSVGSYERLQRSEPDLRMNKTDWARRFVMIGSSSDGKKFRRTQSVANLTYSREDTQKFLEEHGVYFSPSQKLKKRHSTSRNARKVVSLSSNEKLENAVYITSKLHVGDDQGNQTSLNINLNPNSCSKSSLRHTVIGSKVADEKSQFSLSINVEENNLMDFKKQGTSNSDCDDEFEQYEKQRHFFHSTRSRRESQGPSLQFVRNCQPVPPIHKNVTVSVTNAQSLNCNDRTESGSGRRSTCVVYPMQNKDELNVRDSDNEVLVQNRTGALPNVTKTFLNISSSSTSEKNLDGDENYKEHVNLSGLHNTDPYIRCHRDAIFSHSKAMEDECNDSQIEVLSVGQEGVLRSPPDGASKQTPDSSTKEEQCAKPTSQGTSGVHDRYNRTRYAEEFKQVNAFREQLYHPLNTRREICDDKDQAESCVPSVSRQTYSVPKVINTESVSDLTAEGVDKKQDRRQANVTYVNNKNYINQDSRKTSLNTQPETLCTITTSRCENDTSVTTSRVAPPVGCTPSEPSNMYQTYQNQPYRDQYARYGPPHAAAASPMRRDVHYYHQGSGQSPYRHGHPPTSSYLTHDTSQPQPRDHWGNQPQYPLGNETDRVQNSFNKDLSNSITRDFQHKLAELNHYDDGAPYEERFGVVDVHHDSYRDHPHNLRDRSYGVYRQSPERHRLHEDSADLTSSYENIYDHADLSAHRNHMHNVDYENEPLYNSGFDADRYYMYAEDTPENDLVGGANVESDEDLLENYTKERELFESKQNYAIEKEMFEHKTSLPQETVEEQSSVMNSLQLNHTPRHLREISPQYSDADSELMQYYNNYKNRLSPYVQVPYDNQNGVPTQNSAPDYENAAVQEEVLPQRQTNYENAPLSLPDGSGLIKQPRKSQYSVDYEELWTSRSHAPSSNGYQLPGQPLTTAHQPMSSFGQPNIGNAERPQLQVQATGESRRDRPVPAPRSKSFVPQVIEPEERQPHVYSKPFVSRELEAALSHVTPQRSPEVLSDVTDAEHMLEPRSDMADSVSAVSHSGEGAPSWSSNPPHESYNPPEFEARARYEQSTGHSLVKNHQHDQASQPSGDVNSASKETDRGLVAYHGNQGFVVQFTAPQSPLYQSAAHRDQNKPPLLSRRQLWQQRLLEGLNESTNYDGSSLPFDAVDSVEESKKEEQCLEAPGYYNVPTENEHVKQPIDKNLLPVLELRGQRSGSSSSIQSDDSSIESHTVAVKKQLWEPKGPDGGVEALNKVQSKIRVPKKEDEEKPLHVKLRRSPSLDEAKQSSIRDRKNLWESMSQDQKPTDDKPKKIDNVPIVESSKSPSESLSPSRDALLPISDRINTFEKVADGVRAISTPGLSKSVDDESEPVDDEIHLSEDNQPVIREHVQPTLSSSQEMPVTYKPCVPDTKEVLDKGEGSKLTGSIANRKALWEPGYSKSFDAPSSCNRRAKSLSPVLEIPTKSVKSVRELWKEKDQPSPAKKVVKVPQVHTNTQSKPTKQRFDEGANTSLPNDMSPATPVLTFSYDKKIFRTQEVTEYCMLENDFLYPEEPNKIKEYVRFKDRTDAWKEHEDDPLLMPSDELTKDESQWWYRPGRFEPADLAESSPSFASIRRPKLEDVSDPSVASKVTNVGSENLVIPTETGGMVSRSKSPVSLKQSGMAALLGVDVPEPGVEEEQIQPAKKVDVVLPTTIKGEKFEALPRKASEEATDVRQLLHELQLQHEDVWDTGALPKRGCDEEQDHEVDEEIITVSNLSRTQQEVNLGNLKNTSLQYRDGEDGPVDLEKIKQNLLRQSKFPIKSSSMEGTLVDTNAIKKDLLTRRNSEVMRKLDDFPVTEYPQKVGIIKDVFGKDEKNIESFMPGRYANLEKKSPGESVSNPTHVYKGVLKKNRANIVDDLTELEDLFDSLDLDNERIMEGAARRDYPPLTYKYCNVDSSAENETEEEGSANDVYLKSPASNYREGSFDSLSSEIRRSSGASRPSAFPDKLLDDMSFRSRHMSSGSDTTRPKNLITPDTFLSKSPAMSPSMSSDSLGKRTPSKSREPDAFWDDMHFRQIRRLQSSPGTDHLTSPVPHSPTSAEYLRERQIPRDRLMMRIRPEKHSDKFIDDMAYRRLRKDVPPIKPVIPDKIYQKLSERNRRGNGKQDRLRRAKSEPAEERKSNTNPVPSTEKVVKRTTEDIQCEPVSQHGDPRERPTQPVVTPRKNLAKGVGIMIELYNSPDKSKSLPDLNDDSLFSLHLNVYGGDPSNPHQPSLPGSAQSQLSPKLKTPRAVKQNHELRSRRQLKNEYPRYEDYEKSLKEIPSARVAPMQLSQTAQYHDQLFPDSSDEMDYRKTPAKPPRTHTYKAPQAPDKARHVKGSHDMSNYNGYEPQDYGYPQYVQHGHQYVQDGHQYNQYGHQYNQHGRHPNQIAYQPSASDYPQIRSHDGYGCPNQPSEEEEPDYANIWKGVPDDQHQFRGYEQHAAPQGPVYATPARTYSEGYDVNYNQKLLQGYGH